MAPLPYTLGPQQSGRNHGTTALHPPPRNKKQALWRRFHLGPMMVLHGSCLESEMLVLVVLLVLGWSGFIQGLLIPYESFKTSTRTTALQRNVHPTGGGDVWVQRVLEGSGPAAPQSQRLSPLP
ncbi:hypothetical protein EYF80_066554 [Liparis tanakae]|uniref:Uncharacterized protein n=1 Tax=Liparis tanakae TaxID=230148 RepID=A0A4Z2E3N5_9TELE|nr:hypothetical protein EYF80_066554 [Liparis tanakae]